MGVMGSTLGSASSRANTKTPGFAIAPSFEYIRAYLRSITEEAGLAAEPKLKEMFNESGQTPRTCQR